jgi:hypothetical protein
MFDTIKDILAVIGGAFGMIFKFILIIAFSLGGCYCFGTMFMVKFIWDGLMRLGICAACVLGIIGLLRIGREKDDEVTEDDFRP